MKRKKEPSPREARAIIAKPGRGKKTRDWDLIKSRFMTYEWLTYNEIAKATGIPLGQIQHRAMQNLENKAPGGDSGAKESWTQERSRITAEAHNLAMERVKNRLAKEMTIRIEAALSSADVLRAKGLERLVEGSTRLDNREAIAALAEARKVEEAVVFKPSRPTADGDEDGAGPEVPDGVVLLPVKAKAEAWGPSKK